MPRAKALKVKVQDRPGVLGEVASLLGEKGINVRGMQGWVEGDRGVLCFVVDKLGAASRVLVARGMAPEEEEVLEVELPHKPGAVGEVARKLGDAGVNIRFVFSGPAGGKRATVYFAVSDVSAGMKALR